MNCFNDKNGSLPPIHNSNQSTYSLERKKEFLFSYSKLKKLFREDKRNSMKPLKYSSLPSTLDHKISTMARMLFYLVIYKLQNKLKKKPLNMLKIAKKILSDLFLF